MRGFDTGRSGSPRTSTAGEGRHTRFVGSYGSRVGPLVVATRGKLPYGNKNHIKTWTYDVSVLSYRLRGTVPIQ
jgi:hypothetical protein